MRTGQAWLPETGLATEGRFFMTPRFIWRDSCVDGIDPLGIDIFVADGAFTHRTPALVHRTLVRGLSAFLGSRSNSLDYQDPSLGPRARMRRLAAALPVSDRQRQRLLVAVRQFLSDRDAVYVEAFSHPRGLPGRLLSEWLGTPRVGQFEDLDLPVPANAYGVLSSLYGSSYMVPIGEGLRVGHASRSICVRWDGVDTCLELER